MGDQDDANAQCETQQNEFTANVHQRALPIRIRNCGGLWLLFRCCHPSFADFYFFLIAVFGGNPWRARFQALSLRVSIAGLNLTVLLLAASVFWISDPRLLCRRTASSELAFARMREQGRLQLKES